MWKFDFNCIKKCLSWTLNVTSINPFTLEDLTSHYRLSSYMLSEKDTKFLSWQCELQPGIEHAFVCSMLMAIGDQNDVTILRLVEESLQFFRQKRAAIEVGR
jgi:hypothetical protein